MSLTDPVPLVFTAQSKRFFYCRDAVSEFVFRRGAVPLNPFRVFDYFLNDRVNRDLVRQANLNLVRIVDEVWVFGDIADGVLVEVRYAASLHKPLRFFSIDTYSDRIRSVTVDELHYESEIDSVEVHEEVRRLAAIADAIRA